MYPQQILRVYLPVFSIPYTPAYDSSIFRSFNLRDEAMRAIIFLGPIKDRIDRTT